MKKSIKWLLIGAGIPAAILLTLMILGTVVRHKIEAELARMEVGDLYMRCETVRVNLFRQSVRLGGVTLKTRERQVPPDSLLDVPVQFLDATIDRVILRGIGLNGLKNKRYEFNTLLIDAPKGTVVTRQIPRDTLPMQSDEKTALASLNRLGVKEIEVTGGFIDWRQITEQDTLRYLIYDLDAQVKGLLVDSTRQSRERFLYSDHLQGSVGAFRYTFARGDYILALDSLEWNASDGRLFAVNAELMPQHPKNRFVQESPQHSDYTEARAQQLTCSGVDFPALWNEQTVRVDSIHVVSGHFLSYKNRQADYGREVKPMIHTQIQRLGVPIDIRKIKLDDFNAAYEELAVHGTSPGRVTFDHIDATFYGYTNIVSRPDQYIELYATSQLMNQGELHAVVSMPVDPQNDRFEVKATLLSTSLPALNPMVTPLARVELKAGQLSRMDFSMAGSGTTARADMVLRYSGLEVSVLKVRNGQWRERGGISNLVNWAVIKSENPDAGGLRTASETIHRDPYRSTFNYLWKGISAGAMETAETGTAKRLLGGR